MGSPEVVTLGQHYNVRKKPTVILYTYIDRHARPSNNSKKNTVPQYITKQVIIIYDKKAIEPYKNRGLSQQ